MLAIGEGGGRAHVTWQPRRGGNAERLTVQRIINTTGVETAARSSDPLVRNLQKRGLVRFDQYGPGLDVSDTLRVIGANGREVPNLWALGPIVRGVFWKCTAVPDIRTQAVCAAQLAAASTHDPVHSLVPAPP